MRALIVIAGALAITACGTNGQAGNTQNLDENLTAENIVSNDVTAIDAVTGDAANMAADVDMNFGGIEQNGSAPESNQAKPSRPAPEKPATAPQANSMVNTTTNAE